MNPIHPIQINILKVLLFNPEARFTDINALGITSDHFNFHVKRLLDLGLVDKKEDGLYRLTNNGKEYANRFDVDGDQIKVEKQGKITVIVACERGAGKSKEYLIQQRLKEPFYGYHGFMTGKVKWGETVEETAKRELEEETGLEADLVLVRVKHRMDYNEDKTLLEDKFFFEFQGKNIKGSLKESITGGKNMWLTKQEILLLPDLFLGMKEYLETSPSGQLVFVEEKVEVKRY